MASTHRSDNSAAPQKPDHLEDLVDEAGAESFPASDPPAVTPRRKPVRSPAVAQPEDGDGSERRPPE